jgi:hypothetical protein
MSEPTFFAAKISQISAKNGKQITSDITNLREVLRWLCAIVCDDEPHVFVAVVGCLTA